MAIEPLPKIGRNDTFEQVRESLGAALDTLEFLFNGGLDSLNIRRLTADKITTGTLDAGKVTVRANLTGGAYIEIDSTGMTVSDGSQTTLRIDTDGNITMIGTLNASVINGSEINGGTITGPLIQTGLPGVYPRAEMSSSNQVFEASNDGNQYVRVAAASGATPAIELGEEDGGKGSVAYATDVDGFKKLTASCSGGVVIWANYHIDLVTNLYKVRVQDWNSFVARSPSGQTLQQALDAKANGSGFSGVIPPGSTITVVNGVITGYF